jgi:hypothetical protein
MTFTGRCLGGRRTRVVGPHSANKSLCSKTYLEINVSLTSDQIEKGWRDTFSTSNPYCPCNLKTFTKAVYWAQHALASNEAAAVAVGEPTQEIWEYSFIHSSALGRPDEKVGPCLTYNKDQAFGVGCIEQRLISAPAPRASAEEAITQATALAFIDQFEIVGDNNDSRDPTDEEKFVLHEFVLQLFDDMPAQPEAAKLSDSSMPKLIERIRAKLPQPHVIDPFMIDVGMLCAIAEEKAAQTKQTAQKSPWDVRQYPFGMTPRESMETAVAHALKGAPIENCDCYGCTQLRERAETHPAPITSSPDAVRNQEERETDEYVIKRLSEILAGVAVALKGPELPLHRHGYQDLVDIANALKLEVELYRANAVSPAPIASAEEAFQSRVQPWMLACFGAEIAADKMERNHRFFEESTETVQANGMTRSEAHQLVDYVYDRPVGELHQEVGGVMVTLAALCLANGLDMHAAGDVELERINVPETIAKIRAKQAAKPKYSPLPTA